MDTERCLVHKLAQGFGGLGTIWDRCIEKGSTAAKADGSFLRMQKGCGTPSEAMVVPFGVWV
eukprot:4806346-Pleurochrysis_carterae.AAC.3